MSVKRYKPRHSDRRKSPRRRALLVENWREAHKWLSVQIAAVIASAQALMVFVPSLHEQLPESWMHGIMAILAIALILGRVKNQKGAQK